MTSAGRDGDTGKINPPLREAADCAALWDGIASGLVDTVATDHVHRDATSKEGGIWAASPGCPGLETLLPIMLSEGFHKRRTPDPPSRLDPVREPGTDHGSWRSQGHDRTRAMMPISQSPISTQRPSVSNTNVVSSAGYSIYDGWTLNGKVVHTIVRGKPVLKDGKLLDAAVGHGKYLHRTARRDATLGRMHGCLSPA